MKTFIQNSPQSIKIIDKLSYDAGLRQKKKKVQLIIINKSRIKVKNEVLEFFFFAFWKR